MNIFVHIDNLEKLHQALKKEYLNWASDRKDRGIGTKNNPLTLKFIDRYLSLSLKKQITQELGIISNFLKNNNDLKENYQVIKEIYIISPSFHEKWFFSTHFATNLKSIIKGRLGIKAFLTSKKQNTLKKNLKAITTFITKRTILLENLFPLRKSLLDMEPSKNIKKDIYHFLNLNKKFSTPKEIKEELPNLFKITHYFLKKTKYYLLRSGDLIKKNSWLKYAPCSINEGPIFLKTANKKRVEIFKQISSFQEDKTRLFLSANFKIKEIMKQKLPSDGRD